MVGSGVVVSCSLLPLVRPLLSLKLLLDLVVLSVLLFSLGCSSVFVNDIFLFNSLFGLNFRFFLKSVDSLGASSVTCASFLEPDSVSSDDAETSSGASVVTAATGLPLLGLALYEEIRGRSIGLAAVLASTGLCKLNLFLAVI